jgi:RHS repeat-associated protein
MGDVSRVSEASSGFEARFTRNQLGLEMERSLPGGVVSRWRRDTTGRPLQHEVTAGAETLRATGYTWDVNDRLRRVIDGLKGTTEYSHDALGNLARAQYSDGSCELRMPDAVGNLFRTEQRHDRKYGPAGQLLVSYAPHGETRYAYDVEGNLIAKTEPTGACWQYFWNGAGMLSKVRRPDGSEVSFAYDPLGRRVKKTYRGQTTRWVWDRDVPLHEWVEGRLLTLAVAGGVPWATADVGTQARDEQLDLLLTRERPERGCRGEPTTWLFEPGSFAPMARARVGDAQSIVCDHLGIPAMVMDDTGARVWSADLSVYGALREVEGDRWACPFRLPGQYEDPETGLYYNRFRYYDAESGQYASQDPIGLAGGLEAHAYVHDPLTWMDPLGLSGCGKTPTITADELRNKSRAEIGELAARKGLIPIGAADAKSGLRKKWKDPVNGNERLRLDRGHVDSKTGMPYDNPRAAVDHVHGLEPDGRTKIRDPFAAGDPHFPTTGE